MDATSNDYCFFVEKLGEERIRPIATRYGSASTPVMLVFTSEERARRIWADAGYPSHWTLRTANASVLCSLLMVAPASRIDLVVVDADPDHYVSPIPVEAFAAQHNRRSLVSSHEVLKLTDATYGDIENRRDVERALAHPKDIAPSNSNRPSWYTRTVLLFGLGLAIGTPFSISRFKPLHEHVLTVVLLSSLSVFAAFYFYLIGRAVFRGGLLRYMRWSLTRDLRVWLLPLPIAVVGLTLLFADELRFVYAGIVGGKLILYISTVNLLRSIGPPQVLLLHTFDDRNYPFAAKLALATWSNVISLCPRQDPMSILEALEQIGSGQGSRYASDAKWRRVIQWSMRVTDAIVMDLSNARAGLLEEMQFVCDEPKTFAKTVFVTQDRDAGISGCEALARVSGADVPVHYYGHLLHDARARLLGDWGRLGRAINDRMRPKLTAELAGLTSIAIFVGVLVEWFGR